jgi:hypothetical protein
MSDKASEIMCYYCKPGQDHCANCWKCNENGHLRQSPLGPMTLGYCEKHFADDIELMLKMNTGELDQNYSEDDQY